MINIKPVIAALFIIVLMSFGTEAQQQRRTTRATARGNAGTQSLLTGVYRLDQARSDDPRMAAVRAASGLPASEQRRVVDQLAGRLESPEQLAIERRGRTIDIASSRAPRISFEADGIEHTERAAGGRTVSTRAVLYGEQLMVSTTGSPDDEFTVIFDPIEGGRGLRVTRHIYIEQLRQPVVVQSFYNKSSTVARWGIFNDSRATTARNNTTRNLPPPPSTNTTVNRPQQAPPVIRERPPQPAPQPPARDGGVCVLSIPHGTQFVTLLNNDLSTERSREGDPFTMTVQAPAQFEGATIEGYVSHIERGGRISGRPEMLLEFRQIRLRDGRTAPLSGYVESVRAAGGEEVRVSGENSGSVQERGDQSARTAQRAAIGAAVGAIIGAIADGGKGAAIGAAIGAGVGAGSVYAQGRDDLELRRGTELTVRSRANR